MPLYEYTCPSCATSFERRRKYDEREAAAVCPGCGAAAAPVLSVPAMVGASTRASAAPRCDTGPTCCGGGMCQPN